MKPQEQSADTNNMRINENRRILLMQSTNLQINIGLQTTDAEKSALAISMFL